MPIAGREQLSYRSYLYCYSKGMARISGKNQVTIPVAVLEEAGLHAGDRVVVEALEDGQLRIRRGEVSFESAFGALTGVFPVGYLDQLDREDAER
jgi:AbrB family looped-hinge helix DNA binding protein